MNGNDHGSKVVLFLGAGASAFAGYCTFVDFPNLLFDVDLRQKEQLPPLFDSSARILNAVRSSLQRGGISTTHDNFLWRLNGYRTFLDLNSKDDVLQRILQGNDRLFDLEICTQQAVRQMSSTTVIHYSANRVAAAKQTNPDVFERMRRVFHLYHSLARLNGKGGFLPVFTTNYDMLVEDLAAEFNSVEQSNLQLVNGIPNRTDHEASWHEKDYQRAEVRGTGIHLRRLHGCACWFYHEWGDSKVYFHRRDAAALSPDKLCAMYPGKEVERGAGPHGSGFRTLFRSLLECQLVVFIGFSFRDDDVMHLLLKAMDERRDGPKILVVDALYTHSDVRNRLEIATKRSQFPFRLPQKNGDLRSINLSFGEGDSDIKVLEACQELLKCKNKNRT
jgi:hypothetical protein